MLVGIHFHFGIRLYWVLVTNAAIYALAGVIVETMLRLHHGFQPTLGPSK
jgi:predicted TIM-barrel fold metal-dependent hydrolase